MHVSENTPPDVPECGKRSSNNTPTFSEVGFLVGVDMSKDIPYQAIYHVSNGVITEYNAHEFGSMVQGRPQDHYHISV